MFEEIWDSICDGFSYIFSFEWFSDIGEFFSSMFENMGEFSITGLVFGLIGSGIIFATEQAGYGTVSAFTATMPEFQKWFWTITTYLGCFLAGYLIGKHFDNTG